MSLQQKKFHQSLHSDATQDKHFFQSFHANASGNTLEDGTQKRNNGNSLHGVFT